MTKDGIQSPRVALIVALDEQNGIGREGGLLCHLPADLKHFKEVTTGHCIIMGRKTYESLPKGALPNRTNIVLTSDKAENYPGCIVARSLEEALAQCNEEERVFVIGGGEVYRASLHVADTLYITRIHHTFEDADTFFPRINPQAWELVEEKKHEKDEKHNVEFSFIKYMKKNEQNRNFPSK